MLYYYPLLLMIGRYSSVLSQTGYKLCKNNSFPIILMMYRLWADANEQVLRSGGQRGKKKKGETFNKQVRATVKCTKVAGI